MTHLTTIPDTTTVLAYHTSDDVQAVRLADGSERLYVNGAPVPLTPQHHHAVQQVINYCHMSKLQRAATRKAWLALATTHTCSICRKPYSGYGNNAAPVNNGRCCDACAADEVLPARIRASGVRI